MKIEIIQRNDLQRLKDEIVSEISLIMSMGITKKEWLKSIEVQAILGVSSGTLFNYRESGQLPFKKERGTMFYTYADVMQLMNKLRREDEEKKEGV